MDLGITGTLQPVRTASVQDLVIYIQTVIEEITLNEFHGVFNLALAFGICSPAEVNFHPAVLAELLEFVGIDNAAAVFTDTDDTVLVEYHFPGHTAPVAETVMAGSRQIHCCKRSALALRVFVSGMGEKERGRINLGPGSVHILESGLTEVRLHLMSHGKLGYSLIASWIGMPGKPVFLSEFFHIPGNRPLGMIFFVMLFQPVTDLCCRKRRIFPEPGDDPVPVGIQIPDADDFPGIMLVLIHIHIPIPFYGLAVDTQSIGNGTLGKACLPHLLNLAVHVIPLHFVTAFPLEYSHCTRESARY